MKKPNTTLFVILNIIFFAFNFFPVIVVPRRPTPTEERM